jgi:hypothetical protein
MNGHQENEIQPNRSQVKEDILSLFGNNIVRSAGEMPTAKSISYSNNNNFWSTPVSTNTQDTQTAEAWSCNSHNNPWQGLQPITVTSNDSGIWKAGIQSVAQPNTDSVGRQITGKDDAFGDIWSHLR